MSWLVIHNVIMDADERLSSAISLQSMTIETADIPLGVRKRQKQCNLLTSALVNGYPTTEAKPCCMPALPETQDSLQW